MLGEPFKRWPEIDGKDFDWLDRQGGIFTAAAACIRCWSGFHDDGFPQEELMREAV